MKSNNQPKTGTFINKLGKRIYFRNWQPDGKPKGVLLIIHGLNSHSEYYEGFGQQLRKVGYEVYAMDLVGRGESEGERYYIEDYHNVFADIDMLLGIARTRLSAVPAFLFGHSAGGVFAGAYAVKNQNKLHGLISESFAFRIPAPAFALSAIKFLARLIPHVRLVKLNNEDFSRDQALVHTMNSDPLLRNEKQPARTMQQLILAAEYLNDELAGIKLPVLALHGTADSATEPAGSEYFIKHISSADKQLKLYEGHYHDLLNDTDKEIVIQDILEWLDQRI